MIQSNQISIVVQGPVRPGITSEVLQSIRNALPEGEIILSVWEGSDVTGLEFDKVVLSPDPGAVVQEEVNFTKSNINRQIVSTKRGLELVSRPYVLKFRTDILLNDASFLEQFEKWDRIVPPLHVKNRILICSYYTRNPRVFPLPFHPSDWVLFGCTEDIQKYFDVPLEEASEIQWFKTHKRLHPRFFPDLLSRYVPEQYFCIHYLEKFENIQCDCFDDATKDNILRTEQVLAGDFVVLDYQIQFNLRFAKYHPNKIFQQYSLLSHDQWKQLFQEHCLGNLHGKKKRLFFCFWKRRIQFWQQLCIKCIYLFKLRKIAKKVVLIWQRKDGYMDT